MTRPLGQTGIFVEIIGKYYLDEAKLVQLNQSGFSGGGRRSQRNFSARQSLVTLRIIRIGLSILVFVLILEKLFYFHSAHTWIAIGILDATAVVVSVIQINYLSRLRSQRFRNFQNP